MNDFPSKAHTVVIGGGVAGCSVAYHLCKQGIKDVVLLERKRIGSGTSYHAAGMIRNLLGSDSNTWLSSYTNKLLANLTEETGVDIHYRKVGSLFVTNFADRMDEFRSTYTLANSFDLEAHLLSAAEMGKHWGLLNTDDLLGGIYMPDDALVNPYQVALAFAEGARKQGAMVLENTKAEQLLVEKGRVVAVKTEQGVIHCDNVVICGGAWSRDFMKTIDVNVPLHGCEHYYVLTEDIEGVHLDLPALRDFDARCYLRPVAGTYWNDGGQQIMCGFFEETSKPWGHNGIDEDFEFGRLDEDWEHLNDVIDNVKHRIPALRDVKMEMLFNGPESFTYDNNYFVGQAPNIDNVYVGTGLCSRGIQASGGVGYVLSDLIKNGRSTRRIDFNDVELSRAAPYTGNKKFLYDRAGEALGLLFGMHYPYLQMESARPIKTSALHHRLKEQGACFGEAAGWERPNFYTIGGEKPEYKYSYGKQNWHKNMIAEHQAVRNNVALFDQSSLVKFFVQGADAVVFLNQICGANIDVAVGRIIYTQALTSQGGIAADWTITRMAKDQFMVVTGVACQNRDFYFLKNNIPEGRNVVVTDVTSSYAVIGLMGPQSRALLSAFSPDDFSNEAFPFFTSKIIDFGYARVRANRLSYVGELGWEIYIPTEFALSCYDQLVQVGAKFDLGYAGFYVMNALRLEKGYLHWGHDMCIEETPLEAGLDFAVKFNKQDFNGKEILLAQKEKGVEKRLVSFKILDNEPLLYHYEPIYYQGKRIGRITSGMFSPLLDCSIGLGYINAENGATSKTDEMLQDDFINNADYEIEILSKRYATKASTKAFYDPENQKMRA
jgi:4-methylaminobutanoate oxidase (formaldehyde-forming)